MSKILIIAEKPSVATDLARVLGKELGKFTRDKSGSYYENDQAVITSAVGHLLEQKKPMTEAGKALPWKFEYLPVIPKNFELEPIKQSEDRLKKVMHLAKGKQIVEIVNACDAGREGELIFHNLVRYGKWKKPIKRLWMQSMTDDAILNAWHHMRNEEDMQALTNAAVCRSESDWLIGLNGTRALTILQSRGGFNVTPAGRVQTPTLAILAKRELEIQAFKPEPYSEVVADFQVKNSTYVGKWVDTAWKKSETNPHSKPERIWDTALANSIAQRCQGKQGSIKEEKKPVSTTAPLLYDLTSLQREAANRFGFSAKRTLQLAQECYEKHKVLTYPRTDSRYLPQDYLDKVAEIVQEVGKNHEEFGIFAKDIIKNKRIKLNKRIFDNTKVSDHFAIIPTGKIQNLTGDAQKIYEMVLARFLAVFFPPAIFEDTKRMTSIQHDGGIVDNFLTTGRVLVEPGWQAVYGRKPGSTGKEELVPIVTGESANLVHLDIRNALTKPPARYNEATLLAAMEGAGKLVDDDELAAAMSERGLGTPATRASIIEGLISQDYVAREGRELLATRRGIELINLLQRIGLKTMTSPSMTGEWEYKLKQMEQGNLDRDSFMKGIKDLTGRIIERVRDYREQQQQVELPQMELDCPACHSHGLKNTLDAVSCRECKFTVRKAISGREMSEDEIKTLITQGKTPILQGFTSRFGKPFEAGLELNDKFRSTLYFPEKDSDEDGDHNEIINTYGEIPVLQSGLHELVETAKAWKLPSLTVGKDKKPVSISRTILGRELTIDQIKKILTEGKSDLLKGFISQRTKRPFDAFLLFAPKTGKISFEFPPREKKTPAKKAETTKKATKAKAATPEKEAKPKKTTRAKKAS